MFKSSNIARILLVCACLLQIQCTSKVDETNSNRLDAFFGTYTGSSANVAQGEASERDLSVKIEPKKHDGFRVEWTATTYRADGDRKEVKTAIDFYPSPRPGIFTSAMRKDVFGNMVSYDPTGADAAPYVWASLHDDTLTVRALYILENGESEMHTYNRTLSSEGLALEFERTRNRELITQVSAILERTE